MMMMMMMMNQVAIDISIVLRHGLQIRKVRTVRRRRILPRTS